MRVALVSHYYAPHTGGVESLVAEQAKGLIRRGCQVEVLTTRLRGDAKSEIRDGVTVRRYRALDLLSRINVPVPIVSPTMMRQIRRGGYDVIVAHGHCYLSSVYVALATKRPFILWQSNPFVEYGTILNTIERTVDLTIGKWVASRASRIVAISDCVADYVATFRKADVKVVYPGVNTDLFTPAAPREKAPGEKVVVRTLRRLVPRQGVDTLVRAWRSKNLGQFAVLEIGGNGLERTALESLAAGDDSIVFHGRIPDSELVDFYVGSDLFVLPTNSGEGYGLVVAEALSCGRPVVATRSGGPEEIVRDGIDGLLVPRADVPALARAMVELVTNHQRRHAMAHAAAQSDLSQENGFDDTLQLLTEVAELG